MQIVNVLVYGVLLMAKRAKPKKKPVTPGTLLFCDPKQRWEKFEGPYTDYAVGFSASHVGMVLAWDEKVSTDLADQASMVMLLAEDGVFWTIMLYDEIVSAYE